MVELWGLLLTSLVFFIPGLVLSFALFTGTKFNKLDRVLAGVILGLVLVPLMYFLEFLLFGLKLNVLLILANALLVLLASVAVLHARGLFKVFSLAYVSSVLKQEVEQFEKNPVNFLVPVLLVLIVFFGFYLRIAYSFITNFFEFDPYYYGFLTEMLVQNGAIPFSSDFSYFPLPKFHHEPAVVQYVTGAWYMVYNLFTGIGYDKGTLILINNIYPPIVGALLSLLAFWFLREQYNELAGLAGALFFASTPILLQKFAAGVAELQPWGVFSALLIFTAYTFALRRKELPFIYLASLATFVAILGAVQSLWPIGVLAAFFILQAFVNYYAGHNEFKLAFLSVVFSASVFIATMLFNLYSNAGLFTFPVGILLALLSCIPAVAFYLLSRSTLLAKQSRSLILIAIIAIGGVVSLLPILPSGQSISSVASDFIEVTSAFATYAGPLSRTIAEETPTSPGALAGAFGIIGPIVLLALAAILVIGAVEILLLKNHNKSALAFVIATLATVIFRVPIANFTATFGSAVGLKILVTLGKLLATNEVFSFLIISIASTVITFIFNKEETRNEAALLSTLVVYPVAYIGLNKIKFVLHLSFALVVATGLLIGEIVNRGKFIYEYLHVSQSIETSLKWTSWFAVVLLVILGSVQVFGFPGKAPGVVNSVQHLGGSQISQDWLGAMSWLRNNTNFHNPSIQANCKETFGHDCRVISWWDYGHWTAFLGETKTVLDPGNHYEFMDQEVAYGFVDNQTAFRKSMEIHNASHVLVDFQLLDKWGALVFLSGTCQKTLDNSRFVKAQTCPNERQIQDWKAGAGSSQYELEHYFERLSVQGRCPFAESMLLVQSSFGLAYCVSQEQIVPVDRNGLRTELARDYEAITLGSKVENIDANKHYLIPLSQDSFINVNPDFSIIARENKVINSTFTRLYVFENLPGFELAYRSPHGEVKIFKRISDNS